MDTIKLVQGDTKPDLILTLRDSNKAADGRVLNAGDPTSWAPIDLTGASVAVKIRAAGSTTVKATLNGVVLSPETDGRVRVQWTAEALDTVGDFTGEIEITFSDASIQTVYDTLRLKVRAQY